MMRILLTGANGQVGWELNRTLTTLGTVFTFDRQQLDLAKPESIRKLIQELKPDILINAAAYTAVDKAESEKELAMMVNSDAVAVMAKEVKKCRGQMIHYSTDYVFDGTGKVPYSEANQTNPINVYGKSKLLGELAIIDSGVSYLIFRTAWVYANRGKNFVKTMLRLAKERDALAVVNDQIGSPTWARHLAEATSQILSQSHVYKNNEICHEELKSGIYHMTCQGEASWFEFAQKIFEYAGIGDVRVKPIASADYPQVAARPKYSVLSNEKLNQEFSIRLPRWEDALRLCMNNTTETPKH